MHSVGVASRSCGTPVSLAEGREVTTLDGLGTADKPHPVQRAFVEEQAAQCGYCTNGMVMTAAVEDYMRHFGDLAVRTVQAIPMQRAAQPRELAEAIVFLLSDAASFITGIALPVDGGKSVQLHLPG